MLNINQACVNALTSTPDFIWTCLEPLLKRKWPPERLEELRLERYAKYLVGHFDEAWERATQNRKCMVIRKGEWLSTYFNVAVANNMMALIVYALYKGCVPVIKLNEDDPTCFHWDWYFEQPHDIMKTDITGFREITCDIVHSQPLPEMRTVHTPKVWQYRLFKMLFQRFIQLNKQTQAYVDAEINAIGDPAGMIGVVLRGTDYLKLKPAGHPIQPEPEEIAKKTHEIFSNGIYSAVYVATEEKKLFDLICNTIGKENAKENKRQYYDDIFYGQNIDEIGNVHFNRENDNYHKSLEYLSSLMILSKCNTLVAGNCGATLFAVMMGNYCKPVIFDYGMY